MGRDRRRVVIGMAAAAACLAVGVAIVTGTPVLDRSEPAPSPVRPPARVTAPTSDGMPTASVQPTANDYVMNGLRYQARVAGAALQVAKIDDRPLSFTWTPTGTKVDFRVFCTIPGNAWASGVGAVVLRLREKAITTRACDNVSDPLPGERFGAVLNENLGVRVGEPVQLAATVVDGNGRELTSPGLLLGAAVYTTGETRAVDHRFNDIELPVFAQFHGRTYRLAEGLAKQTSTDWFDAIVELRGPAFEPYLVVCGVHGSAKAHSLELAGTPGGQSYEFVPADGPASGLYLAPVHPQAAGPVFIRQVGLRVASGELFLALYTRYE